MKVIFNLMNNNENYTKNELIMIYTNKKFKVS